MLRWHGGHGRAIYQHSPPISSFLSSILNLLYAYTQGSGMLPSKGINHARSVPLWLNYVFVKAWDSQVTKELHMIDVYSVGCRPCRASHLHHIKTASLFYNEIWFRSGLDSLIIATKMIKFVTRFLRKEAEDAQRSTERRLSVIWQALGRMKLKDSPTMDTISYVFFKTGAAEWGDLST